MDVVVVYIIIFFTLLALCIICPRRGNTNNISTDLNFYRFGFIDNDTETETNTSSQQSSSQDRSSPLSVISV